MEAWISFQLVILGSGLSCLIGMVINRLDKIIALLEKERK